MKKRHPDSEMVGKVFGRLTVIKRIGTKGKHPLFLCRCSCGNEKAVVSSSLCNGNTQSCGCLHHEVMVKRNFKHGMSDRRLKAVRQCMLRRCYDPECREYRYYGARGITVCDEWRESLESFYRWARSSGYERGLTLDREDTDGNYCSENCRWVSMLVQSRNRRCVEKFEGKCQTEWAEVLGISVSTFYNMKRKRRFTIEQTVNYYRGKKHGNN